VDVIGHPEGRYVGSGTLTERPFGAAVSRKGLALVTRLDAASVAVVDIATRQAVGTIPVGYSPTGVTFDREGNFAYVTNQHSQSIGVIDVAAREQVDEVAIGGTRSSSESQRTGGSCSSAATPASCTSSICRAARS